MAVVETFAELLSARGIPATAAQLPDEVTLSAAMDRVDVWFWDLTPAVREGYDEATGEEALAYMLAEPEFAVASDASGLLQAFDQSSGLKLSECIAISRECLQQSLDAGTGVG